jgi:hypothetical protein
MFRIFEVRILGMTYSTIKILTYGEKGTVVSFMYCEINWTQLKW